MNVSGRFQPRLFVAFMFFLTGAGLAFGIWALFPYLQREHNRLPAWEAILLWIGDATNLIWFVYFFVAHSILGRPLQQSDRPALVMLTMFSALAVDLAITLNLMREEKALFEKARVVMGQVEAIRTEQLLETHRYHLVCSFQDGAGNKHASTFVVDYRLQHFIPELPPALAQAILQKNPPFAIRVSYVESFPKRNWMSDLGWEHANSFCYFSLLILSFQAVATFSFLALLWSHKWGLRQLPWWYDLHKPLPLLVEAGVLALFGFLFGFL